MHIKFIDHNTKLVKKINNAIQYLPLKKDWVTAEVGDIFDYEGIVVSASNPDFTMGGGLDALIALKFPHECKQVKKTKKNARIKDVIFTITVNEHLKATRELVDTALSFAFSHVKSRETLLITGLGTGIGGMDEDEFVYLFLKNICTLFKIGWGLKYTQKNGHDFHTGTKLYEVGIETTEPDAVADGEECATGLHLGKSFAGCGNYCRPEKIFFCIYDKKDLCGEGQDKVRVKKLFTIYELPQWMGYGPQGKKIVKKIGKDIDSEDYNPYSATKLPSLTTIKRVFPAQVRAQVGDQVRAQVWAQVGDQVRAQVWAQVGAQVWDQVGDQVRDQVGDQVGDQVRDQVGDQVGAQVRDQVGDQVRAVAYMAIKLFMELDLDHWFYKFIKLGIMVIFVADKMKVFGKKGKYLGEYSIADF